MMHCFLQSLGCAHLNLGKGSSCYLSVLIGGAGQTRMIVDYDGRVVPISIRCSQNQTSKITTTQMSFGGKLMSRYLRLVLQVLCRVSKRKNYRRAS